MRHLAQCPEHAWTFIGSIEVVAYSLPLNFLIWHEGSSLSNSVRFGTAGCSYKERPSDCGRGRRHDTLTRLVGSLGDYLCMTSGTNCGLIFGPITSHSDQYWSEYSFFFFLATPCSLWNLSSPTRDRTPACCSGRAESEPLDRRGNSRSEYSLD